eukprot:scaffold8127_cov71-Isochrysis_galbana.AAC.1
MRGAPRWKKSEAGRGGGIVRARSPKWRDGGGKASGWGWVVAWERSRASLSVGWARGARVG